MDNKSLMKLVMFFLMVPVLKIRLVPDQYNISFIIFAGFFS
jgi:hypothetical protein